MTTMIPNMKLIQLLLLLPLSYNAYSANKDLCLLTDMSIDIDDLGALQMALFYHHIDEINLRCVIVGTSNSNAHRVINHMIGWWGYNRRDIRIGNNITNNGISFRNDDAWVNSYVNRYDAVNFAAENGALLLNEMLDRYSGMLVVEIGPATTTYNAQAINRIQKYMQMGGEYPSGYEFNMISFITGARYIDGGVVVDWYDERMGYRVCTGQSSIFMHQTPVYHGYRDYTGGACRPSWDLMTILGAVYSSVWFYYRTGDYSIGIDGKGSWSNSPSGRHRMAFEKNSSLTTDYLNSILAIRPQDVTSLRRVNTSIIPILQYLLLDD